MTSATPAKSPVHAATPSPRRIAAVLFDVDDTLIDTAGAFAQAIAAIRRAYLPHIHPDQEPEMLAMWRNDVHGHYRSYTRGEIDMDTQRRLRADELHAAFGGRRVRPDFYPEWLGVFWGTFERAWRAHPEVQPVLAQLRAAGIKLGLVTNASTALQRQKLAIAGLSAAGGGEDWFGDVLIGTDTLGFGKPDPRVFYAACAQLEVAPERTAYVGDEPDIDAKAAAEAGLLGVWLDRPGVRRHGPSAGAAEDALGERLCRITSLTELPGILGLPVEPKE